MYIYKAAVIGGGQMGAEIAQVITFSGLPVKIKEINEDMANKAVARIRKIYEGRVKKGKMTPEDLETKLGLVEVVTDYSALDDVDLVIEAVPEKLEIKQEVFKELDKACPEHTILASNTSALSISALGAATARPEKVVGIHFFYPAHVMKLVEVIPGLGTSDEVVDDSIAFAESLRKIAIRVNECAGFLVNRLLMPYLNEAAYCLQEGQKSAKEIDAAMVEFGFPMGPFTLVDNLGLDICYDVVGILLDEYGDRMNPAAIWNEVHSLKRLGVKSGNGFYSYENPDDKTVDEIINKLKVNAPKNTTPFSPDRLLAAMINEAAYCIQENVCSANDLDVALLAGTGFPQGKGGLLKYADTLGLDVVLKQIKGLQSVYGNRFFPAPYLSRLVNANFLGEKTKRGFLEYT